MSAFLIATLALNATVISLDDAVRIAIENHPDIAVAAGQVDVAEARARERRSALLPRVDSTASYELSAARPPPGPWSAGDGYRASVSSSVLIYDFGRTRARVRSAVTSAEATRHDAAAVKRDLVFSVRLAYIDVLEARAMLGLAQESLANEERYLRQAQALVDAGERPRIDLVRFETRLAEARSALVRAEADLASSRTRLARVMGVTVDPESFQVTEPELTGLALEGLPVEELLEMAFEERDDLESARLSVIARRLGVEDARRSLWPSLRVSAGLGAHGEDFDQPGLSSSVGLSMSWPLFDGFASSAVLEAERAAVRLEEARLSAREHEVWAEIREVRTSLNARRAQLDAAEQELFSAREMLRLAEARYAEGVADALELATAQLDVSAAAARMVRADYDLAAARASLLRALGRRQWS